MANSYLIKRPFKLTRQEANTGSVVFILPDEIPMAGKTATFVVVSKKGEQVFKKVFADMTLSGQTLTVPLLPADTRNWQGVHLWELKLYGGGDEITAGEGEFEITNKLITT